MDYPQVGLQNVDLSGGLGGYFAGAQQAAAERQRAADQEKQTLANTYQQLQNERYGQETPYHVEKLQGEAMEQGVKGRLAKGTENATLQQKLAEAYKGKSAAELEQYLNESESMVQKLTGAKAQALLAEKSGNLPQVLPQLAKSFGLDLNDPNVQQRFSHILKDPSKLNGELDKLIKAYQEVGLNTTKHIQEMDKQSSVNQSHEKVAAGNNAATLGAAKIHADATKAAAEARGKRPETVDQMVADATRVLASSTSTPEEKAEAQQIIDTVRTTKLFGNPAAFNEQVDLSKIGKGIPTRASAIEQARAGSNPSPVAERIGAVAEGTIKMVGKDKYKKVKGGWELVE